MNQEPKYFTVKLLEDYLGTHCPDPSAPLSFRETLSRMNEEGRLLTDNAIKVRPCLDMSKEEFNDALSDVPLDCTHILELTEEQFLQMEGSEAAAFAPGLSVICRKTIYGLKRRPRELEYFDLYYVKLGQARLDFEEDSFILREGDLCILPPGAPHSLYIEKEDFVINVNIRSSNFDSRFGDLMTMSGVFSGFFRESLYGSAQPNFLMLHTKPGDRAVDLCIRGLAMECFLEDKHSWSSTTCFVKLLLSNALRSCGEKVEIYRFPTGGNPRADCGEILQYIQQNYRTVRLSSLAQQFHYNETYLSRMLQNYAHQSFTEIVRDIRMNRAVEYLVNSSLRVHEIAGLVGYSSVDHFSRAFKVMYGMSPQAYRRKNRK